MANKKRKLTEDQIDEIVIKEADDLSKWESPVHVKAPQAISLRLSPQLIQKAKFLATLHKSKGYQSYLEKIIKERIQLEEKLIESIKPEILEANDF